MNKPRANAYIVSIGVTCLVAPVMWAVWKWGADLYPILVTWMIVHPIVKIWRELGDL